MKNENRTSKSAKNLSWGLLNQVLTLILGFVVRTIFIRTLGVEYLGLNSLFTNILSVLSLADLGFGSAMLYSLYKPLAEKDEIKLSGLLNFYKKVYRILALVVLGAGLCLLPFLKYIVNLDNPISYYHIYYLLFLLSSVFSYTLVYKSILIDADQKMHIIQKSRIVFALLKTILQIIALVVLKNYLLFLIIQVLSTLFNNLYLSYKAKKMYSFIHDDKKLTKNEQKEIFDNVKSLFFYKIGGVILNNTDNIIISIIVGTIYVGYYSNYLMIVTALTSITAVAFQAVGASLGNLNNVANKEKQFNVFKEVSFLTNWVFSLFSICLVLLFNDFITLWLGKDFTLGFLTVIIIVINFYMPGTMRPISVYRDTLGLFKKTKFIYLITALINIVLSIVFGLIWGIFGVLLATAISRLITNYWYEPYVLMKDYFNTKVSTYLLGQLKWFIITVGLTVGIFFLNKYLAIDVTWLTLIIKGGIIFISINIIYLILFYRNTNFKELLLRVKYLLKLK